MAFALSAASFTASAKLNTDLLGTVVQSAGAERTVAVDSIVSHVTVQQGETVTFVSNGQTFTYRFDGAVSSFDLSNIAPAGMVDHKVRIQVEPISTAG